MRLSKGRNVKANKTGIVPHFVTDLKAAAGTMDARAESSHIRHVMGAFAVRRDMVPAGSIRKWRPSQDSKRPRAIARTGAAPLPSWPSGRLESPGDETLRTFAAIITAAHAPMC